MAQERIFLAGSGSRMEAPLFAAWAQAFNRGKPTVQVGYVPTSSAEGIQRLSLSLGDFAAGEIRLEANEEDSSHLHLVGIPIALVGVVPIYNLPGITKLRFTGELLGQIYTRMVSRWNDPLIARLNPGIILPDLPIRALDRAKGSGLKSIFDEFVSRSFAEYRSRKQQPKSTIGGGDLVAQSVALTPGAIGYVAVIPQEHHGASQGLVRNSAGKFVRGNADSIYAAYAARADALGKNLEASLVDATGTEAYPMVGFVWIYLPTSSASPERMNALRQFIEWALNDGQQYIGESLLPLPKRTVIQAQAQLEADVQ
jgi:phosphate transport system substrate-binding protein